MLTPALPGLSMSLPLTSAPRIQCRPTGPCPSTLMIVGEAPGEKEVLEGSPFVGPSGYLLDKVLSEAGLLRGQAFLTNVCRERPPGNDVSEWIAETLKARTAAHSLIKGKWVNDKIRFGLDRLEWEIGECKPHVVIALGNLALWALTGKWGVRKWRSSIIQAELNGHKFKVIPTIHPAGVLREWTARGLLVHDLRRAATELGKGPIVADPNYSFIIRPNYPQALAELYRIEWALNNAETPVPLGVDIETRAGHTACGGLATSATEAICIPWMCVERPSGYWTLEQETVLVALLNRILTHPKAKTIWQNGAYDHQYEHRWHFIQPQLGWDTMLAHHAMFSIDKKSLDHLSSLYCDDHLYWKDDGKLWDPSMPEDQLWHYNCVDCVRTFKIAEGEQAAIDALTPGWPKLPAVVAFQHRVQPAVVRMMFRGVRSDDASRQRMAQALMTRSAEIQGELTELLGAEVNIRSPKQMVELFYETLNQTPIYARLPNGARGNPTCDDEALEKIAYREPLLRPVVSRIQALRSAGVFLSTFVQMPRDTDGRIRCSYNVAGTVTYRFSSSENAFGSGGNLQNIPKGDDDEAALILLPNIRELFVPDHGKTIFDIDGDSADLRIVTWESGCVAMKEYFTAKVKPYVEIAREFYRDPTITKHHRSYKVMKALCHGTNYLGQPQGLSERIGLPVHDIERMQKWYFGMCPEILKWQEDIKKQVDSRGFIENPFGQRLWIWDRISKKTYNEAVAWIPQSSVGQLINRALVNIDENLPEVELLLQVHDSLAGQFPSHLGGEAERAILEQATVPVECRTGTLIVPMDIRTSKISWGHC